MSQLEILEILAAASIKGAAILTLAGLVTAVWRGASASTRHLVWTIGVSSALLVPILGAVAARLNAPAMRVTVWTPPTAVSAPDKVRPSTGVSELPISTGFQYTTTSDISKNGSSTTPFALTINATGPTTVTPDEPRVSPRSVAATGVQPPKSISTRIADLGLTGFIYLYLAGVLVSLLPLLIGVARLRNVARRARLARNHRWSDLISRTPAIAHFAGRVRIVESEHHSMPMTWGIIEPTLLVPANSEDWPDWKCRNILLHELAHVERRDCLTQLVAQVACSAYWFNPLVWVAAHRMRIERELACDDRVISAGSVASDYASNLLDVARTLRSPSFTSSTAIAMARPSQLSGRLLAVLDATRNRSGITRGIRAALSGAAVAIVIPMSFIIPGASSSVRLAPQSGKHGASSQKQTTSVFSRHALATIAADAPMPSAVVTLSSTMSSPQTGTVPLISTSAIVTALPQTPGCYMGDGKGGTSIQSNSSDDNRSRPTYNIRYTRDNCSLEVTAEGKFTLRPDLSDLETIASDGWFRVEERVGRESHRVEIRRADNGSLDHQYWVNGDRTPYNDEARAWLARTLLTIERRTAVAASSRVPQLYRSAGVRGVMSEIALMEGEYPKSIYYKTFLGMGVSLDANTLNSIVKQSATDLVKSDYYLAEVLSEFAKQPSVNETTWRTFAEAAGGMKSDYYKSEVLKKVLKSGRLSPQTVGILLNSESSIKSDYYLSDLLQSVASQYAVNADTRQYYVNALRNIESDYYRGEVLKTLDNDGSWDARTSQLVLASASDIKSDYYREEALSNLVKSGHVTDWPSFFNSVAGIGSDYYKKAALSTVLEQRPLSRDVVTGVLGVVPRMKSDSEASEVLSKVASSYRIDDSLRPAFEKAVDSIDSDYYRGSALSALRRSMAR